MSANRQVNDPRSANIRDRDQSRVQVANDGDVAATVDWHGPRLDIRYDGIPDET
jgi:hypothetical protein